MSTPRRPSRLAEYSADSSFYPRELTEKDGKLYFINENGSATQVNPSGTVTIKDATGNVIGSANSTSDGDISIPNASTDTRGLVVFGTDVAKAAGSASAGISDSVARADHVHPIQTTISGNAGTATKLATARTIGLSGVTATAQSFDGSANITIPITAVPASIVTGLSNVATSGKYSDLSGTPSIPGAAASTDTPLAAGTAAVGISEAYARADHVHPLQTTVSGNAGSATKLATARTIGLSGVTATAQSFDGSTNITIPITAVPASIVTGLATVATSGKYSDLSGTPSIPTASSVVGSTPGTAAVGVSEAYARADHVHPVQTTVSGNAGSATKLATARTIGLSGAVTGTATSFNGTSNITIPVTSVDGTKITGIIPLSSIPKGAQERLYPVTDDTARLALTSDDVQNGDVVKVESTGVMYYVVDDTALGGTSPEDAFMVFTAGAASSVDWSGVTNKPTFATVATSGSYNDLSNKPTIPAASTVAGSAAGTAAAGTSAAYARADHVHPVQTTVSGNAGSATKLATARTIGLSGVTATAQSFDGSANITIPITAVPASIVTGLAAVATSGSYNDLSNKPTIPSASNVAGSTPGTAAVGTSSAYARADHVHPIQTTVSGNAGSATKLATARTIGLSGVTATAQSFDGSTNITIPITAVPASIVTGLATVATSGSYNDLSNKPTIPTASNVAGSAAGTAAVGISEAYARADHVHPIQTTVSGNAGTATKLASARTIGLSGVTATAQSFDGSANITIPITAVPASIVTGLATVATSGSYNDLSNKPSTMAGATSNASGTTGFVPAPAAGKQTSFLRGDGTWVIPTDTTYSNATTTTDGLLSATDKIKLDSIDDFAKCIPFIAGTQTATTGSWTGNAPDLTELVDGQTIRYWLPYAGSGNATLNLTLADGSTTGAIACYRTGTSRLTTQYAAGNVITLTYRKNVSIAGSSTTYTGWWVSGDYSTTTASSVQYSTIKCGTTAIVASNIIVGKDGVYGHLKSGNDFDITYPILYASSAIAASATSTSVYISRSVAIATTQSMTLTAYKPVFIKGSLNGTVFTPISTTPLTQDVPTEDDGYEYIFLGVAISTANVYLYPDHPIFAYKCGAFSQIVNIAGTASKLTTARTIGLSGVTATAQSFDGTANITIPITAVPASIVTGLSTVATSGKYSDLTGTPAIPTASTVVGSTPGTAAVGTSSAYARADHVHPIQTTVSGNAGTATKFASAQSIELTGDVTGSASSQAGWSIAATLASSGVTAGSYGPSANASPASGGSFSVPYVTVDEKGRVTSAATRSITLPSASHPSISTSTDTTSSATPAYGGTFTAVDSVTRDSYGHVTKINTKTLTLKKPSTTYTASIGTTWTGSAAPYTQTITVSGITADDNPIVDVVLSSTYDTAQSQLEDYGKIYRITTGANSITVYANEKTEAALDIQLKCIS